MLESYIRSRLQERSLLRMTHLVVGYPSLESNWELLEAMEEAGVDLVEMQFPFSEPVADGPLFSRANQAALDSGIRIADCFSLMERASSHFQFPILMMGYYNTVFRAGEDAFCKRLVDAGGKGLIVPDLPMEEGAKLQAACAKYGLDLVPLVAPTTTVERMGQLATGGSGFTYAVARKGVTGSSTLLDSSTTDYLAEVRRRIPLPLAVGFGIGSPEDMHFLEGKADIAVVGSAVLRTLEESGMDGVRTLLKALCE